jgi:hypothetical protein
VWGAAAGGGDDGDSSKGANTTSTVEGSTSTAVPVSSTLAPTATDEPNIGHETDGDRLLDGKHFGYITTVVAGHNEIDGQFDLAELYTGSAAEEQAHRDGTEVDDDYYIRNVNPQERPIRIDAEAVVLDIDDADCCEPHQVDPAQWVADRDARGETRTAAYITLQGGVVTKIEEVFFP